MPNGQPIAQFAVDIIRENAHHLGLILLPIGLISAKICLRHAVNIHKHHIEIHTTFCL